MQNAEMESCGRTRRVSWRRHSAFSPMNPLPQILILLLRVYRVTLSPAIAFLFGASGQCRFEPSCSCYAMEALKTHGALAGGWLAAKRVCRCHPWGDCGDDPVPPSQLKVKNRKPGFAAGGSEFRA
jgi:putative membrane protein insertion efficiency factor